MNKKYLIATIIVLIVVITVILIAGMNLGNFNKQTNNTTNTTKKNTINVTHMDNNTDGKSSKSSDDSSRYREVKDKEYLGDQVVYEDTATGKYYYQGQEMNYEKLADDYNREHKVGPYA